MSELELLAVEGNGHHPRVVCRQEGLALIHGDAREMRELPTGSVDLVITDPPFNVSFSDYGGGVKDSVSPEEYGRWTGEWLRECVRVLRDGGQLYAIMPLKWLAHWLPYVPERWHLLAWCKTMAHLHRERTYIRAWEPILWVVKGGRPEVLRRAYRFEDDRDWLIGTNAIAEVESQRFVKKHPTPRPAWLYEYFILRASEPGMVVLDPMMGSGTGAYAARKLGRQFVGYDINRGYVELAAQRVAQMSLDLGPVDESIAGFKQLELAEKWESAESRAEVQNWLARLPRRFRDKVQVAPGGCWLWKGARIPDGYGHFRVDGHMVLAHRYAYETVLSPVPDGAELDHLCRDRGCVNPGHLQAVPHQENVARGGVPEANRARAKEACHKGHPFTKENTYRNPTTGRRACRTCMREWDRQRKQRRKER